MLRLHINLATNPFVNYRQYYLLGTILLLMGVGGAVYAVSHYLALRQRASVLEQDLSQKQSELTQLTARSARLKEQLEQPQTLDTLDQINFYNTLIQRKTFPWAQFFKDLESVLPYNVKVTQIQQRSSGGSVNLEMVFMGRTTGDAVEFLRNLTSSGKFHGIFVDQEGTFRDTATHRVSNEVEVSLHMQYQP